MSDRPLSDMQRCADGTTFAVHSELIRGEPRFYWVEKRRPGGTSQRISGTGSHDKRSAQRAVRRLADAHDKENG